MICDIDAVTCTMALGVPVLIILLASMAFMLTLPAAAREMEHFWKRDWQDKGDKP